VSELFLKKSNKKKRGVKSVTTLFKQGAIREREDHECKNFLFSCAPREREDHECKNFLFSGALREREDHECVYASVWDSLISGVSK
jgi:hypothetical protein